MAANSSGSDSTGRKNYYNIAYGMLSTNAKDAPEGYEKISLSDIKSRRQKNENVDLRQKYYDTENEKDYPLRVFYTDIDGIIDSIEKDEYSKGISLKVTLHDEDGDVSILQTDFYGKVSTDFLNRLLNVNTEGSLNFRPYSIPSSFESKGEVITYYNSGVSIKDGSTKIDRKYKGKDSGLPASERIKNSQGKEETSRVKQIDFLWEQVSAKFADLNAESTTVSTETATSTAPDPVPSTKAEPAKKTVAAKGGETVKRGDLPF